MFIRVLVVEDDPSYALLVREHLGRPATGGEFALVHAERLADALRLLGEDDIDVILADLGLPDSQGIETFLKLRAEAPGVPAIVLTGRDDEALGIEALREGAQDYLVKRELDGHLLPRALRYAIERSARRRRGRRTMSSSIASRFAPPSCRKPTRRSRSRSRSAGVPRSGWRTSRITTRSPSCPTAGTSTSACSTR